MSTTKREQILAKIATTLAGTTGVSTRIYRSRVEPIAREESPAVVIEPVDDDPVIETHLSTLTWTLTVLVTVIVRGPVPDQLADPIIASIHSKLMADYTLGGIAMDIMPGKAKWILTEADGAAGEIQIPYRVMYRTSLTDLTVG